LSKARNHIFDFLCGVAILRMMLNHITSFCGLSHSDWWQQTYYWTFFLLSFFFFKAGYFNKSLAGPTLPFLKTKARALLVPYATSGLLSCVIYFLMLGMASMRYHNLIEHPTWEHLWQAGGTFGNPPLWFLLSFFATYVGMHLLQRWRDLTWLTPLLPTVSYWLYTHDNPLWLSLNNVFTCMFLFQLGRWWRQVAGRLSRLRLFSLSLLLVTLFVVLNVAVHGEYTVGTNIWQGNPGSTIVLLALALCGLSGLLLAVRLPRIPLVNYVGEHSMVYFIGHFPVIVVYRFVHITFGHSLLGRWDDFILLLLIVPIVCSWLVPYIERTPWFSGRFPQAGRGE